MKKIALITGGSRGIGLGIAKALLHEGYAIAINGVREESKVEEVVSQLRHSGQDVIYCQGDVGQAEDRRRIISKVIDHFGHLNILVNNAGVAPNERKDLLDMSEASYDRVLNINLKGSFFMSQLAAKEMIKLKRESPDANAFIVNMSSVSATMVSVNRGQYCISKAGMTMVTQLFAARLGEVDIPVYEIRPGIITTDMTSGVKEKYDALIADGLGVQSRWGTPEDVANVVVSIARNQFAFSTGQVFMVDGGLTMQKL